jgi:hypothetical protein
MPGSTPREVETLEHVMERIEKKSRVRCEIGSDDSGEGRLMRKRSLFDCAEKLAEVSRFYGMIRERKRALRDGSSGDEGKLLDSWIGIYKNTLKRMSGSEKVTPEYVEALSRAELAEGTFIARAENETKLAKRLGGFMELDSAVRVQLGRELSRVEAELERREQIYEDELRAPEYSEGGRNRDNLELLLGGAYELAKMRKRCGLGVERTEMIRQEVERRLRVGEAKERLENNRQKPEFWCEPSPAPENNPKMYLGDDKAVGDRRPMREGRDDNKGGEERRPAQEGRADYSRLISEARSHLAEIYGRYSGGRQSARGVIGIGGIREIFAARDSYYNSLRLMGGKVPTDEIEDMIGEIYSHDKEEIDEFIRQNGRGSLDEETIREAAYYRKVMDSWERCLRGGLKRGQG